MVKLSHWRRISAVIGISFAAFIIGLSWEGLAAASCPAGSNYNFDAPSVNAGIPFA
jgi:hypothetical protein